MFYIQTCNICASQYHIIYKVVHLCFLLMLYCKDFLMLLLASVKLSLNSASWWLWIWWLAAGKNSGLVWLMSGPRSSSLWTKSCFWELSVVYCSYRALRNLFLPGVSRRVKPYLISLDWLLSAATHSSLSSLLLPVVSAVLCISLKSPMRVPRKHFA